MPTAHSIQKPANYIKQIHFRVRVGTEALQLKGSEVHGRWSNSIRVLSDSAARDLAAEFANWPGGIGAYDLKAANEIMRFTRRYGPLESAASTGAPFVFNVARWSYRREEFCGWWRGLGAKAVPKHWAFAPNRPSPELELARTVRPVQPSGDKWAQKIDEAFQKLTQSWPGIKLDNAIWLQGATIPEGEFLARAEGRLIYGAGTLWNFLLLTLFATPGERLRRCHSPECRNPFFIARHLNQNFCSDICARWGQRRAALAWWNKKGKAARAKQHKGGKR